MFHECHGFCFKSEELPITITSMLATDGFTAPLPLPSKRKISNESIMPRSTCQTLNTAGGSQTLKRPALTDCWFNITS